MQSLTTTLSSLSVCGPTTSNPVDVYRSHLTQLITDITGAPSANVYPAIQFTQSLDKGDLSLATPALRLKGRDLNELAQKLQMEASWRPAPLISRLLTLSAKFPNMPLVEPPVADRTFVQFFFKPALLTSYVLLLILELGADYGCDLSNGLRDPSDTSQGRKRVVVDFGSPNIAKPFHAGHLRSTIVGGFLANLYEQANWEVVRLNYPSDWGKQYGVHGAASPDSGSEEELQRDPINHLFHIYVKASACAREQQAAIKEKEARIAELQENGEPADAVTNEVERLRNESRMCDGEGEELALWKRFREQSIHRYKETFAVSTSTMTLLEKLGKAIVPKKDGTSICLTRDIGTVFEQTTFRNAYNINFGLVPGMSTRRGTVSFLDDILRDAADKMHEVMRPNGAKYAQVEDPNKTADILGISAVLVQDMSGKRINNYTFDMNRMTSFEGDTGPYLQYSHARLCSIIRKADVPLELLKQANLAVLTEQHATTFKTHEPVTVLTYLFKLTHALNSSYDRLNILKSKPDIKLARLTLYSCVCQVLSNGMKLLGLTPVER
ncbi:Nucleotidylyl transferase [Lentithecium fluviatile CBS 122367]|uniref:arginine--tRNA ligase n=1 Tax=Lentithecium fluviatile CBS 122367 TaxID=1168545 RepID=A0A6G1IS16_9PLEO|nr:Nucleotidylyl transferase [Lentithecium fluviatile CBS 122367]